MNARDSYGERGGPAPSWHQEPWAAEFNTPAIIPGIAPRRPANRENFPPLVVSKQKKACLFVLFSHIGIPCILVSGYPAVLSQASARLKLHEDCLRRCTSRRPSPLRLRRRPATQAAVTAPRASPRQVMLQPAPGSGTPRSSQTMLTTQRDKECSAPQYLLPNTADQPPSVIWTALPSGQVSKPDSVPAREGDASARRAQMPAPVPKARFQARRESPCTTLCRGSPHSSGRVTLELWRYASQETTAWSAAARSWRASDQPEQDPAQSS
jgi:hypothetical protein